MTKTYHVGILHHKNGTAEFQFRENRDCLNCEILEYLGEREQTKEKAKAYLREHQEEILSLLAADYPGRAFKRVTVS